MSEKTLFVIVWSIFYSKWLQNEIWVNEVKSYNFPFLTSLFLVGEIYMCELLGRWAI